MKSMKPHVNESRVARSNTAPMRRARSYNTLSTLPHLESNTSDPSRLSAEELTVLRIMSCTSASAEMTQVENYQYPDPGVAQQTWVPAYPILSPEFTGAYYGTKVARAVAYPWSVHAIEQAVKRGVEAQLEHAQTSIDAAAMSIRARESPPIGSVSQGPDLEHKVTKTMLPTRSEVTPEDQHGHRLQEIPARGRKGRLVLRYEDNANFVTPSPAITPGRKRKARGDSKEAESTTKRSKVSKVISNIFTSLPAYATQTPVPLPSSQIAPLGVNSDELVQSNKGRAETATGNYGGLLRGRIQVNAQMPLHATLTIQELATFHPHAFQIPEVAKRMICNKITSAEIARIQLEAASEMSDEHLLTLKNRLKYQYSKGGFLACHDKFADGTKYNKKLVDADGAHTDLTADQWRLRSEYTNTRTTKEAFGHVKLEQIYGPVPAANRPMCKGRGRLTQYLEFAEQYDAARPDAKLDTSHWAWIATRVTVQDPQVSAGFTTLDHEVMAGIRAGWRS
ncbi:hypothetical protein DOTSEDRAFT_31483 [Dothistroma septosporum NZE10]|uniref:Uncharacterized protein n=1 Tax=Dothistroma septosporum (strain NZE10 / CBS 128990) TaxID=675120 RepID=N1PX20_DOTSN|nr:hypothetical protein DOTSEDRAFT_31483 [Dothistroma septosporum NZE10]